MTKKNCLFLLLYHDASEAQRIQNDIKSSVACSVEMVSSPQEASKRLSQGDVDCLVFDTKTFDLNVVKILSTLREVRKNLSILVFAETVSKDIYTFTTMAGMRWTVILEKPYDQPELAAICEKISQGQDILQRQHNRFTTEQAVEIDRLPTPERYLGIIKNMSLGGAFIEVAGTLREGDALKIAVPLPPSKEPSLIYAEVVRVELRRTSQGGQNVGVRFVSTETLYNSLLAKLT